MLLALLLALAMDTAALKPPPAIADSDEQPAGVGSDDFSYVSWCHGAVKGHLEAFEAIEPKILAHARDAKDRAETSRLDQGLMADEREFLKIFSRALKTAEAENPAATPQKGAQAAEIGYRIWAGMQQADYDTQKWVASWGVPPRCEVAAKRLEQHSGLLGAVMNKPAEPAAAVSPAPTAEAPSPAPQAAAEAAPKSN